MVKQKLRLLLHFLSAIVLSLVIASPAFAVVKIGVDTLPLSFSPYASSPLELQYAHLFFDPLVRWDKNKHIEKRLVKEWETISPGIMRFTLKDKIKFHSGNELQSRDVTWTFLQSLKEENAIRCFENIRMIKPVDKYRFDVYSNLSQAQILDYFTHFFILDSLFYKDKALNKPFAIIIADHKRSPLSGTGPYKIKEYNAALNLDVVSNKDYWQGKADLPELNFIKIKSVESRTYALLADDLDISETVSNKMLKTVNLVANKSVVEIPSENVIFLTINPIKTYIFEQETIRQAINLAINKEGMFKHIINGKGRVAAVYSFLNDTQMALPVYDQLRAKSLLSKVRIPLELTLLVAPQAIDNADEITNALINMMKTLGVKLLVTQASSVDQWNKDFFAYDFTLSSWCSRLINKENIGHEFFAHSILSGYFNALFPKKKLAHPLTKQADLFKEMQLTYQITPLLFQNKIWGSDNRFNLPAIFSANGIPYWHLLTVN